MVNLKLYKTIKNTLDDSKGLITIMEAAILNWQNTNNFFVIISSKVVGAFDKLLDNLPNNTMYDIFDEALNELKNKSIISNYSKQITTTNQSVTLTITLQ